MIKRSYIKNSILLLGDSDGVPFKRRFTIIKKLSEGASAVCYEAYHENSGRGVLKEFYPLSIYGLQRDQSGQLIHSVETQVSFEKFSAAEKEYLEPYQMLLEVKQYSDDQDLATFIPEFEIYHGCSETGEKIGTTYIWTPQPKLETFDKICEDIHRNPNRRPEHKLVTALASVEALTKCIRALHSADMIHRDIKPSNFGFIKRGSETLTQTLSMFDINSVCSVFGKNDEVIGTEGYLEPEAGYEHPNNQTDIYAIGATLFFAIIVTDETKEKGYVYESGYYDRLRELVDESKLICASEANSHPRLRNILTVILERCLCDRTHRYNNCEELLEDIEIALYYALPSEIAQRVQSGEQWVLADVASVLDAGKAKNSALALQYHLYKHPLYRYSTDDDESLNVLVIGFGNYGQKFLDACLQAGQMRKKKLSITVVSDDKADKGIYLQERPELSDFFNVDGQMEKELDSYGDISFELRKFDRKDQKINEMILQDLMCEFYGDRCPHYVFIALGDDELNLAAATACKTAVDILEIVCSISCVCEKKSSVLEEISGVCPIFVNEEIKKTEDYLEIERMAFNTHLIWEKNLNVDYRVTRAEFRKTYNHDSCISSVLGLKYKLFSMGIDLDVVDFAHAAKLYQEGILNKSNKGLKNELIWIEHRRWVTEKICLGWRRIRNLDECMGGVTKDERRKRHVCILRSRPDQKLATEYRANGNYIKWDEASETEIGLLDELDRMSVQLHRAFVKKAKEAKRHNLLSGSHISSLKNLIEGNRKASVAYQEWYSCMKDIWNGDRGKVRLYKGLKTYFLNAISELPEEKRRSVREVIKSFEAIFYPVLASMEYRDWKQDDVSFIDNIPFVLTYTENAYMVIPFSTGGNTEVFANVAAPTVVSPRRILYLFHIEKRSDLHELLESVPCVVEYMRKKQFKAAVEFVITYSSVILVETAEKAKSELKRLGSGRIQSVKCIPVGSIDNVAENLTQYLKHRSRDKKVFALEKNETRLSYLLKGAGGFDSFNCYQFDSTKQEFFNINGCELFRYIKKSPYVSVADMTAFRLASSESSNQPEFYADYKELWKKYCERSSVWKQLCDGLGEYAQKNDIIATFRKKNPREKGSVEQEYRYILPYNCINSISLIISFLKTHDIIEVTSCVNGYTTDSCEVVIHDRCGYRKEHDRLFSNIYALMLSESISVNLNTKSHEVNVVFDNLVVTGAQFGENRFAELNGLLEYFKEKGYVLNLRAGGDGRIGFTYATRQIKELLTTAGKMLEVYVYHKVKELGRFDDVVSGYEIDWADTNVKNEFDCILTKGFRMLFVECKARANIEQDFYFKLVSLAQQFGINATPVLIADTQEKPFYDNAPVNAMQRKRGRMLDVITIWNSDEINNIGHTLLKVINGTYVSEEE